MKLIPISQQHLRLNEPLPFGVRDAAGRLLLMAGARLDSAEQREALRAQPLFADETESADWHRRLAAAMDMMLRQNATLKDVAAARPDAAQSREAAPPAALSLTDMWEQLVGQHDGALRELRAEGDWLQRLAGVHQRARMLAERRPDAALYHLIYTAGHSTEKYSSHHALLTMVICELAAQLLEWPQAEIDSLGRAALSMNVAMIKLQDLLAQTDHKPTPEMQAQIDTHAEVGAAQLRAAGMADALCCAVVALHHDGSDPQRPLAELVPERRLARLLRRVDIFCAKMSRRRARVPMSPVQAAREACLGANGQPDEIGAALLRAVGLYPPGSFVELSSGELGIVVARGRRANLPYVASLVSAAGLAMSEPLLRDTLDKRYGVKGAVASSLVKVLPGHERVLALRLP